MRRYYTNAQCNTNPLAHELINHFGSLNGVLSAAPEDLMSIKGVGEQTAALIKLLTPIARAAVLENVKEVDELHNSHDIGSYIFKRYAMCKNEMVTILCLKPNGKIAGFEKVGDGDIGAVGLSMRRVVEVAIRCGASVVVLAHNHPSGIALPSAIDVEITKGVVNSLRQVDIHLADHIIITDNDYVSMAQSQEYKNIF